MPSVKPLKRSELIYYLKRYGFVGPFAGGKHQYMLKGKHSITVLNPHHTEIGKEFLKRILKQAEISIEEWENL